MSDFDPPTPETPSHYTRMSAEATRIEESLRETAKKLGLRIRVTYDIRNFCLFLDSALIQQRANYSIDEDTLFCKPAPLADLLQDCLEDLQLRLHDITAEAMQKSDVRGRVFRLSKEDKHTLNDMYNDACCEALKFGRPGTIEKYQALMERLFR